MANQGTLVHELSRSGTRTQPQNKPGKDSDFTPHTEESIQGWTVAHAINKYAALQHLTYPPHVKGIGA